MLKIRKKKKRRGKNKLARPLGSLKKLHNHKACPRCPDSQERTGGEENREEEGENGCRWRENGDGGLGGGQGALRAERGG